MFPKLQIIWTFYLNKCVHNTMFNVDFAIKIMVKSMFFIFIYQCSLRLLCMYVCLILNRHYHCKRNSHRQTQQTLRRCLCLQLWNKLASDSFTKQYSVSHQFSHLLPTHQAYKPPGLEIMKCVVRIGVYSSLSGTPITPCSFVFTKRSCK